MKFERVSPVALMDLFTGHKEMIKFFRTIYEMVVSIHKHNNILIINIIIIII